MGRQLFIYLGPAAPSEVSWAATGGGGSRPQTGRGPLAQVPRSSGERLVVLVPGTDVLVTETALPGGSKRLLRRSLPFLLEENLADEVEDLHFAAGPVARDNKATVAAVGRARLAGWLAMLREAGLQPAIITPATLALPVTPGRLTLVFTEEGFLARAGDWQVCAGETDNLAHYLRPLLPPAAGEEPGPEVINCSGQEIDLQPAGLGRVRPRSSQFPSLLAEGFGRAPFINLLQGEFAGSAPWRAAAHRWQVPLAAAAALLILLGVDGLLDLRRLRNETERLNREIVATFQQTFPDSRRIVNPRAQMEQKLQELRARTGKGNFFTIYDKVAPLLAATTNPGLEVIRFRDGRLDIDLSLANLEMLERLRGDLAKAPGILAEVRNAENVGGRVRARLSLEVKG